MLAGWLTCGVLWLAWQTAPAHAYEDQLSLGAGAGYAHLVSDASASHGVLGSVEASLGLDDIWAARASVSLGYYPAQSSRSLLLGSLELLYLVDVLEWVPYFGGGLDGIVLLDGAGHAGDLGVHPVIGLDWLVSRELLFGVALRPVFVVSALDRAPFYFTCTLSAAWLLDM